MAIYGILRLPIIDPLLGFKKVVFFHASVLLLIMNFHLNCQSSCGVDYCDNVMRNVIVNNITDALKTDINFF